jgi:3-dehydroquinate synthetase
LMAHDKKVEGGRLRFVLLEKLGKAVLAQPREDALCGVLDQLSAHA